MQTEHFIAGKDASLESTLQQAEALLKREQRFFNIKAPGITLVGCAMHHRLLAAYAKLHRTAA